MDYRYFDTAAQLDILQPRLRNYEANHFEQSLQAEEFAILDDPEAPAKAVEAQRVTAHFAKLVVFIQSKIDALTPPPAAD